MTRAIPDGQSLVGGVINSINNGFRGDFNATPDEIKFHMVCVRSFFSTDFTATKLRQYDVHELDFHRYDITFNCLSDDGIY